jgi:hypothetical protein
MAYGNRYGERWFFTEPTPAPGSAPRMPYVLSVCGGQICSACGCGILAGDVGWAAHLTAHHTGETVTTATRSTPLAPKIPATTGAMSGTQRAR